MQNIYKLFLDYDFISYTSYFQYNNNNTELPYFLKIFELKGIADFEEYLLHDLAKSKIIYIIEFVPVSQSEKTMKIRKSNPYEEIKMITKINLSYFHEGTVLTIDYEDENHQVNTGYLLKFKNAYVLYRNIDLFEAKNIALIPILEETDTRNAIFLQTIKNFKNICDQIYHAKLNNLIHIFPLDFTKPLTNLQFFIDDIKVIYNKNNLNLQYIPYNKLKKYDIIITNTMNPNGMYNFIVILQELTNEEESTIINPIQKDQNNNQNDEYIKDLSNNLLLTGIAQYISQYQNDRDILASVLTKLSKKEPFINQLLGLFPDKTQYTIDTFLQTNLIKYFSSLESPVPKECIIEPPIQIVNFKKVFTNIKSYIIKNNNSNYLDFSKKQPIISLNIYQLNEDKDDVYLQLNEDKILYKFFVIAINEKDRVVVLEKTNKIFNVNDVLNGSIVNVFSKTYTN